MLMATPAFAQTQTAQDAETFAKEIRDGSSSTVLQDSALQAVPGYAGTDFDASKYLDNEDGLTDAGVAQRYSDPNYSVVIDPARPEFDPATIDLSAAKLIEDDPESYIGTDVAIGGSAGACEPLPNTGASGSTYYETCNQGEQVITSPQTCISTLNVRVERVVTYVYYASTSASPYVSRASLNDGLAADTCRIVGTVPYCDNLAVYGGSPTSSCRNADYVTEQVECTAEASTTGHSWGFGSFPGLAVATGQPWMAKSETTLPPVITRNDTACAAFKGNGQCVEQASEVCTDSEPDTRVINGVPVTQPCWAWTRTFQCTERRAANDCSELAADPACTFDHEECLSDNEDGSCNVFDRVYACAMPATGGGALPAFVCARDLYCINGECTQVEREASSEFKDAMVAVQTMGNVRGDFDADTLTLFGGEKAGCHKPVFGFVNCCAGKTSGLLTAAAGAAAIASGPAAIAALATPFLTTFLCDSEEKTLDVKDRMGLCHYVGSYCSDKVLRVCTSKRKSYCCFESKLSRILQEQGRQQLGMDWGEPKEPDCEGFLVEDFQQLNLSEMDFTEVYAEFVDAAKVPDEIQTSMEIQERIEQYYQLHEGP
jgi:conjugal transfer mating pair stabilization protein TraN